MPQTARWNQRPENSTWGDFGENDSLGRLNLVGREQVLKGIQEVRDGQTFSLSLPLDFPGGMALNPNRYPPVVRPTLRNGAVNFNCDMSVAYPGATDVMSDDFVVLHTQYSTQWDALGHEGAAFDANADGEAEYVYYNGWRAGREVIGPHHVEDAGITNLRQGLENVRKSASTSDAGPVDITHMAEHGVQGRAVMIDLEKHLGTEYSVVDGATLTSIIDHDHISIEPGDIVCLHTGFAAEILGMHKSPDPERASHMCAVLDGADEALRQWVVDSDVAAIACDNYAVEAFPAIGATSGEPVLPLHELCLFRLGVHLGELWNLTPLAHYLRSTERSAFLLTAPPLNLPGATGSPVTPIATV